MTLLAYLFPKTGKFVMQTANELENSRVQKRNTPVHKYRNIIQTINPVVFLKYISYDSINTGKNLGKLHATICKFWRLALLGKLAPLAPVFLKNSGSPETNSN